jgi:hypothetical protein
MEAAGQRPFGDLVPEIEGVKVKYFVLSFKPPPEVI